MKGLFGCLVCAVLFMSLVTGAEAYSIRDDATGGDCTIFGIWDAANKTCTLATDLYNLAETIYIAADGITLDGNMHTISGIGGTGIFLEYNKGTITIKNLTVVNFGAGIYVNFNSSNNTFTGNTIAENWEGLILAQNANSNTVHDNVFQNNAVGIRIKYSYYNTVANNVFSYNNFGVIIWQGQYNRLFDNDFIRGTYQYDWYDNGRNNTFYLLRISADVVPDTLNKKSNSNKNSVTAYIEAPGFDLNQISIGALRLGTAKGSVSALTAPSEIGDYDSDGIPDLMVKFDRQAVLSLVDIGDDVEIEISEIKGWTLLWGIDHIKVID